MGENSGILEWCLSGRVDVQPLEFNSFSAKFNQQQHWFNLFFGPVAGLQVQAAFQKHSTLCFCSRLCFLGFFCPVHSFSFCQIPYPAFPSTLLASISLKYLSLRRMFPYITLFIDLDASMTDASFMFYMLFYLPRYHLFQSYLCFLRCLHSYH